MLPLRLVGIKMADEAPDTVGGATRVFLGTAGFISFLIGAEILREGGSAWAGISLIVAAYPIYASLALWNFTASRFRRTSAKPLLSYLDQCDSDLGGAIIRMARSSAWGRLFAAQYLVDSGEPIDMGYLLQQIASHIVMNEVINGTLDVRGRLPGQMEYKNIPRTDWHSSAFYFLQDQMTIWKMHILPTGGASIDHDGTIIAHDPAAKQRNDQIRNYDSLIVDAVQFEKLWPRRDVKADRLRRKLLWKARWRRLNKNEIKRLS
jgi:hypothetical protein